VGVAKSTRRGAAQPGVEPDDGPSARRLTPQSLDGRARAAMPRLTDAEWTRVDSLLAQGQVLAAVVLYREFTRCGIAEAKNAVGERFRTSFPDQFREYRDVNDD
jgi:hypothetical protein